MSKKELLKALEKLKNEYDAFLMGNRYSWDDGENTHAKQFEILSKLDDDKVKNALAWIHDCYDCYYKDELDEDSAFAYLEMVIRNR